MLSEFIYNISPYFLKVSIASNYGYYLKYLRHSGRFYKYIEEALQRESWSEEKWSYWQEERLAYFLDIAYKNVPFYRHYWENQRKRGNNSSHELIENWPVLNKKSIQNKPELFINKKYKKHQLISEYTSGSTGSPIRVYHSKDTLRYWYGLCELRWRIWYDLSYKKPWAYIAGRKIIPFRNKKPPYWVWNRGLKQLYLSCYHLKEQNILHYIDAMREYGVEYLYGLSSSINQLAYYGKKMDINPPVIKAVITCAETLYPHHRKNIEDFFLCPVYDSYGSTEKVIAASECLSNKMHIWPDAGNVEVFSLDTNAVINPGNSGRLICTGLINEAMPLIRYDIGDIGTIINKNTCECKRNMPIISSLDGRYDDMILTPDGKRVMIIWSFLNGMPIIALQIIQEDIQNIRINYVPQKKLDSENKKYLLNRLKENIGEFNFHLNHVNEIDKEKNGKFKAVISKL